MKRLAEIEEIAWPPAAPGSRRQAHRDAGKGLTVSVLRQLREQAFDLRIVVRPAAIQRAGFRAREIALAHRHLMLPAALRTAHAQPERPQREEGRPIGLDPGVDGLGWSPDRKC